ncbi:MAG TPA: helix-turn-helix transcriptional regulator [Tepidisphaeraceae bacterium]|jgi:DNA-binding XRE family transcriptional regulator
MGIATVNIAGQELVVMTAGEYARLLQRNTRTAAKDLPPLPRADKQGMFPAVAYARASLARKIILARRALGMSQAEVARQAGIRPETLNRLEKGRHTPDTATLEKIDAVLSGRGRSRARVATKKSPA